MTPSWTWKKSPEGRGPESLDLVKRLNPSPNRLRTEIHDRNLPGVSDCRGRRTVTLEQIGGGPLVPTSPIHSPISSFLSVDTQIFTLHSPRT